MKREQARFDRGIRLQAPAGRPNLEPRPAHRRAAPVARALEEHGVVYSLVGSTAAAAHGAGEDCRVFELCYRQEWINGECLARALTQLGALPEPHDSIPTGLPTELLLADAPLLLTGSGHTIVAHSRIPGLGTFDDFVADSTIARLDGRLVRCLSLTQILVGVRSGATPGAEGPIERLMELAAAGVGDRLPR